MATVTKFTRGPYTCDGRLGTIHTENGRLLAEVYCPTKCGTATEWAATTTLLAAAPELYAALEAIIAWEQSEDGPFAWEVLGQAKSALAKARGEA